MDYTISHQLTGRKCLRAREIVNSEQAITLTNLFLETFLFSVGVMDCNDWIQLRLWSDVQQNLESSCNISQC